MINWFHFILEVVITLTHSQEDDIFFEMSGVT